MSRVRRSAYIFLLGILLTVMGLGFSEGLKNASADTAPNFAFKINAQKVTDGSTYNMNSNNIQVSVLDYSSGPVGVVPDTVTWSSSKTDVVTLNTNSGDTVTMLRQGPGYSTIKAEITQNGIKYSISFVVAIGLEIDYAQTQAKTFIFDNDKIPALKLDTVSNKTQQIYLKYTDGANLNASLASFKSNNTGVVTVDEQGIITVAGAGSTTITITSNSISSDYDSMSVDLTVIVVPTFSFTYTKSSVSYTCESKPSNTDVNAIYKDVPSNFVINSNADKATNLTWKIYNVTGVGGTNKTLLSSDSKLIQYYISDMSGTVTFTNIKAGTYEIYAFDNEKYSEKTGAPYAYMKIYVLPNVSNINVAMNVNDTYSILDNTNIPSADTFKVDNSYNTNVAYLNPSTGIIKANSQGETDITLKYDPGKYLFDGLQLTDIGDITIHITVIDSIALNMSSATIYTKGTLQLVPIAKTGIVEWDSNNKSVATVDNNGLVTGVKEGNATITASQVINGVLKKATCTITVQPTVTSIVVEPDSKSLALEEYLTLHAEVTPAGSKNVKIHWRSSNDKVVAISETNGLTATVQGLSGGHAVVSAINEDNIVVGYCDIMVRQPVEKITLSDTNVTANLSMKQFQLRATVSPDNAEMKDIEWDTTDVSKATVSTNGLVTLLKPGTVTIVAKSKDNPKVIAYCNINILIPVVSLALNETTKTMYAGESAKLAYTLLPTNASNNAVTWISSNTSVATVDATGKVTAKSAGTAVIILRSIDGGYSSFCTITVKQVATAIKFDVADLKMKTGENYQLKVTLSPNGSTENNLSWQSTDTKVATVDDQGKIVAKTSGIAIIMARTEAGAVAYCKVTVTQSVNGLVLNYSDKTINKGETFTLEASVNPSTATKLNVSWKSSNANIATIDKNGLVKGIVGGTVVITCTTDDGGYSATCVVTVKESVTSIKLNYKTYKLGLKKSFKLIATASNESATNQKFKWTSSNKKIATVSSTGKVYGIKKGYVTITATALDGSEAEASCEVRVVTLVKSVKLSKSAMSMYVGDSKKLKATVSPKNATYKHAKWTTSDKSVAIVDDDGTVIAFKAGNVMITASAMDSSGKKSICYVSVYERVASTAITLPTKSLTMVRGESKQLDPVITPKNSTDKITYTSDNSAVATVSKTTGKITSKSPGTAFVTAMTESGKLATIQVMVIGLNQTTLVGEQYTNYTLTVDGTTSKVQWHSDNPLVAVVYSDGTVSTRALGTTRITATVNGVKLTCVVTVKKI